MPEHLVLKRVAAWLQDFAASCTVMKLALLRITDFVLFSAGLARVVRFVLCAH